MSMKFVTLKRLLFLKNFGNDAHKGMAIHCSSKAYANQLSIGENYHKLKLVIFFGILNFDAFHTTHYFSWHLIISRETNQQDLEWNFIELKNSPKRNLNLNPLRTNGFILFSRRLN